MSSIDEVIARSRRPGGFSERKTFSLARKRGIQKLRRFALADPHHYILELIQSAVANRAQYIDIELTHDQMRLSYIGGGLAESELAQLFDFLFASKDRTDVGHVRELALGLNAVLMFKPERVVVESGDGTAEGTHRMVLHGDQDEVEVGKADRPMAGTYVAVHGMQRSKLFAWAKGEERPRELGVIEERCLAAPVPIIVNSQPLFGFSSQRTPGLFGYSQAIAFDEGDLYGTLGLKPISGTPTFRLLKWGVAIQSREHELIEGHAIGGVLCFDRLRKTVDHSGIVDDDRLEELWVRLAPYAEQLIGGKQKLSYRASHLSGHPIDLTSLRELLSVSKIVVVAPPWTPQDSDARRRAAAIGRALDAPVLCAETPQGQTFRILAGGDLRVVTPDVRSDADLALYLEPPFEPPPRPWLAAPVEVAPMSTDACAQRIVGLGFGAATFGHGEITATVYTPGELAANRDALTVCILTSDRLVWRGAFPSAHGGHVLVVRLSDAPRTGLHAPVDKTPGAPPLALELGRMFSEHATPALATAFKRALARLTRGDLQPGSMGAALGLVAAARTVVPMLRPIEGLSGVAFAALRDVGVELLDLPLCRTVTGQSVDLRTVARWMTACGGLLYGTIDAVPAALDGLDPRRVLALDDDEERLVEALVGDGAFVRLDARDVLAEHDGVVCRDLALGLREYPDFPLLVEGTDPSAWPSARRGACVDHLIQQLVQRAREGEGDKRRQATRHLQWFVAQCGDGQDRGVAALPLFVDARGEARSFAQLREATQSTRGLRLTYGHTMGPGPVVGTRLGDDAFDVLAAPPFVYALLAPLGAGPGALTIALEAADIEREGFVVEAELAAPGLEGRLGMTRSEAPPRIVALLPDGERAHAWDAVAQEHGVSGFVRFAGSVEWTEERLYEAEVAVRRAAGDVLAALTDGLALADDPLDRAHRTSVVLGYAAHHVMLSVGALGRVEVNVTGDLVGRILAMPLFRSRYGGPMSGWAVVDRFRSAVLAGATDPTAETLAALAPDSAPHLVHWVHTTLHSTRLVQQPGTPKPAPPAYENHPPLCTSLEYWLHALRPDPRPTPQRIFLWMDGDGDSMVDGAAVDLRLDGGHWLVRWAITEAHRDPEVLAWLLLAIYAHLNAVLDPITNDHERTFQQGVATALANGRLRAFQPAAR